MIDVVFTHWLWTFAAGNMDPVQRLNLHWVFFFKDPVSLAFPVFLLHLHLLNFFLFLSFIFTFCVCFLFNLLHPLYWWQSVLSYSENDLDDNQELYDVVYEEEDDEIYEHLCTRQQRFSTVSHYTMCISPVKMYESLHIFNKNYFVFNIIFTSKNKISV